MYAVCKTMVVLAGFGRGGVMCLSLCQGKRDMGLLLERQWHAFCLLRCCQQPWPGVVTRLDTAKAMVIVQNRKVPPGRPKELQYVATAVLFCADIHAVVNACMCECACVPAG